ncbi:MAG TPA: hypothetical protein VHW04_16530 [Solirubrobacteraceae bacterium]|nr:hypothetical protein [Solirubrobacteraceae bacterium]
MARALFSLCDLLRSADYREGVLSHIEKRPPKFSGISGPTPPRWQPS